MHDRSSYHTHLLHLPYRKFSSHMHIHNLHLHYRTTYIWQSITACQILCLCVSMHVCDFVYIYVHTCNTSNYLQVLYTIQIPIKALYDQIQTIHMYICICMYACTVCMYVCMYVWLYVSRYMYIHTHVHMCICTLILCITVVDIAQ